MKTFALVLIILGIVAVVCFAVAFFLELAKTNEKESGEDVTKNEDTVTKDEQEVAEQEQEEDFDLDAMLAKLEASAAANASEESEETAQEEQPVETAQEDESADSASEEETVAEVVEETTDVASEESAEETTVNAEENAVEETEQTTENEENVEEVSETVSEEENAEESAEATATSEEGNQETDNEQVIVDSEPVETEVEVRDAEDNTKGKVIVVREHTHEVINNGNAVEETEQPTQEVVDLSTRLASVREAQEKVDADLVKANRDINKYERTERRMARNQKLLDKKAEDLTKLNLVLYSVTDIKNIDADKKQKQEELVTHINELKTSIKDAETYLDANKEKYENAQKMKAFFEGEKARLDGDEKEILTLMGQNTDNE